MNQIVKNLLHECSGSTNKEITEIEDQLLDIIEIDNQYDKLQSVLNIKAFKIA